MGIHHMGNITRPNIVTRQRANRACTKVPCVLGLTCALQLHNLLGGEDSTSHHLTLELFPKRLKRE